MPFYITNAIFVMNRPPASEGRPPYLQGLAQLPWTHWGTSVPRTSACGVEIPPILPTDRHCARYKFMLYYIVL